MGTRIRARPGALGPPARPRRPRAPGARPVATADRAPQDLEVARADGDAGGIPSVLPGEARPGLVDGDDDAVAVDGRHVAVQGREDGAGERLALQHGGLGLLARQRIGEDIAEKPQSVHQHLRPFALGPEVAARENTDDGSPDRQGDRDQRLDTKAEIALPVRRRLERKLIEPREEHDVPLLRALDRPRESAPLDGRRHGSDAVQRP